MDCQQFKEVIMVSLYQFMYRERHGAKLIMLGVSWRNGANTSYLLTEVDTRLVSVNTFVHWITAFEELLDSSVLEMVKLRFIGEAKEAVCLKRQKSAQAAHVPFSVLVALGKSQEQIILSIHEPIIHHYNRLGRVLVTHNSSAGTWHCPCEKPRMSSLTKTLPNGTYSKQIRAYSQQRKLLNRVTPCVHSTQMSTSTLPQLTFKALWNIYIYKTERKFQVISQKQRPNQRHFHQATFQWRQLV